jgi:hypothetical protein
VAGKNVDRAVEGGQIVGVDEGPLLLLVVNVLVRGGAADRW